MNHGRECAAVITKHQQILATHALTVPDAEQPCFLAFAGGQGSGHAPSCLAVIQDLGKAFAVNLREFSPQVREPKITTILLV